MGNERNEGGGRAMLVTDEENPNISLAKLELGEKGIKLGEIGKVTDQMSFSSLRGEGRRTSLWREINFAKTEDGSWWLFPNGSVNGRVGGKNKIAEGTIRFNTTEGKVDVSSHLNEAEAEELRDKILVDNSVF